MTTLEIEDKLYEFIRPSYPEIQIKVIETADKTRQLYFTEQRFKDLFPRQRYHFLVHLIPDAFYEENLAKAEWYELAPNEDPDDLDYHDQETIDEIKEPIISILKEKVNYISTLNEMFMKQSAKCHGDFRHSKEILTQVGFSVEDQFDIFHVLMDEGGYCDCEILLNVFRESEYAQHYRRDNS